LVLNEIIFKRWRIMQNERYNDWHYDYIKSRRRDTTWIGVFSVSK
jgi:hypothetical protein